MSKIVIIPGNKEQFENVLKTDNYLLLGINDLSVNTFNISFDEIKDIVKSNNNIFLSLNKNILNNELPLVEDMLKEISKLNIKGLFYYDVAILNIVNKLKLNINLIWSQEHCTTNYYTTNYWLSNGASGVFLSNEITKAEMIDIMNNTTSKVFIQLFGYIPMYSSKRHAIRNYLKHFDLNINSNKYYLFKEDKKYMIEDNDLGTTIYTNFILNGLKEYNELKDKLDYVIINGYDIDSNTLNKVINIYSNVDNDNVDNLENDINSLFPNLEKGFLYEETIYRVK